MINCLFKLLKSDISIIYYHSLCSNYEYRLFHSLDNLKNHFTLISFCMNSAVYNVRNRAVIELSFVVWIRYQHKKLKCTGFYLSLPRMKEWDFLIKHFLNFADISSMSKIMPNLLSHEYGIFCTVIMV